MFLQGKKYDKGIYTFLSAVLYNAKWIGLIVSIPSVLYWVEKYTGSGSMGAGEYLFWYSCLLVLSVFLFFIDKQWKRFCDAIIGRFAKE